MARPQRNEDDLEQAALQIAYEWTALGELAASLDTVIGLRTDADDNAMEAFLVHYRCMVNFLCGGYKGTWLPSDIQPEDFLGAAWWPPDEELDRRMRRRLPIINTELQHLSWQRVDSTAAVAWSTVFMAHEVTYAAGLLVSAWRRTARNSQRATFG